ncbi:unnamed protein product [Lactuca saligna]|uniref:Uncharacterized protein n=1 Tax=Lactuca saligna TaxID=75948 RepID=A0AA35Y0D7_LACSI|nr:unnamed protein product [Lactuca saligna]
MNEGICEITDGNKVEEKLMSSCSRWSNVEGKQIWDTVAGADESQWLAIRGEPAVANEVRPMAEEDDEKDATLVEGRQWKRVDDQERAQSGGRSVRGVVSGLCGEPGMGKKDHRLG